MHAGNCNVHLDQGCSNSHSQLVSLTFKAQRSKCKWVWLLSDIAKPAWVNRQKCPFTLLTPKPKQNLSSQQGVQVQTWEHHLWRTSSTQGLWILPLTGFQTLSPSPSPTTVPACLSVPFHSILSTPLCDPITTTFLCPLTKQEASPRHSVAATAAPAGLSVSQMSPWSFRALNSGLKLTQFNYFIYCSYFTHVHY